MLGNILGSMLLFPYIFLIIMMVVSVKIGVPKKKRIGWAVDWTTPFVALAVLILINAIWEKWLVIYLLAFLCIVAIVFASLERARAKEFRSKVVLRKTWRAAFLLLSAAYILLIVVGIITQIVRYLS